MQAAFCSKTSSFTLPSLSSSHMLILLFLAHPSILGFFPFLIVVWSGFYTWKLHPKVLTQLISSSLLIWVKWYLLIGSVLTAPNTLWPCVLCLTPTDHPTTFIFSLYYPFYFSVTHSQAPSATSILRGQKSCFLLNEMSNAVKRCIRVSLFVCLINERAASLYVSLYQAHVKETLPAEWSPQIALLVMR